MQFLLMTSKGKLYLAQGDSIASRPHSKGFAELARYLKLLVALTKAHMPHSGKIREKDQSDFGSLLVNFLKAR